MFEERFSEIRADGRTLAGTAIRYGEASRIGDFEERFEPGAFGMVSDLDVILNFQHDQHKPLARTGGGGLVLTDSRDSLRWTATLPQTRDADDALSLVRSGVLRGSSIEFKAVNESWSGSTRTIKRAFLGGLAVVDQPAHEGSGVEARWEVRQRGQGLEGRILYGPPGRRVLRDAGVVARKREFYRQPFGFALKSPTDPNNPDSREVMALLGRDHSRPLGSRLAGTLKIRETASALAFRIPVLPDTGYARDFMTLLRTSAILAGVDVLYRIPPIQGAVRRITEAGTGVVIEQVRQAVLTAVVLLHKRPRGLTESPEMIRLPEAASAPGQVDTERRPVQWRL